MTFPAALMQACYLTCCTASVCLVPCPSCLLPSYFACCQTVQITHLVDCGLVSCRYVMAAGHLTSFTKLLAMAMGSAAHFNPITGASVEANNEAIYLFTGEGAVLFYL